MNILLIILIALAIGPIVHMVTGKGGVNFELKWWCIVCQIIKRFE